MEWCKEETMRKKGERGVDNENEGSETEKEEARQGLWGKDVVVNKAEEE